LLDYFAAHIALKNNDKDCQMQNLRLIQKEPFQVLSSGFQIEYDFVCPERIHAMVPELNLFTDFELQTNRLSIVESDGTEVYYKV
jgi:hypothetical protein